MSIDISVKKCAKINLFKEPEQPKANDKMNTFLLILLKSTVVFPYKRK